jgi:hypothetical protein
MSLITDLSTFDWTRVLIRASLLVRVELGGTNDTVAITERRRSVP